MVRAFLTLTLAQQSLNDGNPIPLGYLAVGGALGLTVFTIAAFRRLQRWSITDLETALARQREEVARISGDLETERAVTDVLRGRLTRAEDEARTLRALNAALTQEADALQAEVTRLRWIIEGTEGLRRPLPGAGESPPDGE